MPTSEIIQHLRRAVLLWDGAGLTDRQLLEDYLSRREAAALAALVQRHGPMVWAVCRRVLHNHHDAEDAFQATFLVLVRKTASIASPELLANWLYGVAHQTALKARATTAKRRARERQVTELPEPAMAERDLWLDLQPLLDQELSRLSDKYRVAIVLCDLEGLTRKAAARQLGVPEGTLAARLARGRALLAKRLARHGLAVSGGLLTAVLGHNIASATTPTSLIVSTIKVAGLCATQQSAAAGLLSARVATLTKGFLTVSSKLTWRAAIVGVAVAGAALIGAWLLPSRPAPPLPEGPPIEALSATHQAPLEGQWRCVGQEKDGKPAPPWVARVRREKLSCAGDVSSVSLFGIAGSFSLPSAPANAIDIHLKSPKGESLVLRGIYSREGDHLRICLAMPEANGRPTGFETRNGDGELTLAFEKVTPGAPEPDTAADQLGAVLGAAAESEQRQLTAAELEDLTARCLKLADNHPDTDESLIGLLWVLANAPDSPAGKSALALLKDDRLVRADLATLGECLGMNHGVLGAGTIPQRILQELAPLLLQRVRRTPDHPQAAAVLTAVCCAFWNDQLPEMPPVFAEAADLIADRWITSPDIFNFLEVLGHVRQRPWAQRFEPAVRTILARTPHDHIRFRAAYTLALLVAESGEARQEEAHTLLLRFAKDYEHGIADQSWSGLAIELAKEAKNEVDAMLVRGFGGPAPPLAGLDLDGKPMDLSQYQGKVVLLSFWGTWCGPCMKLVPHERALQERFKERPFALVGVNGDEIEKLNRKILEANPVTWRSFQNIRPDGKSISQEWNVPAWPTLFLIDHTGKVRRRWIGSPLPDELDREVERWVNVAEGKAPPPAARSRVGHVPVEAVKGRPARFIDRVYKDGQDVTSKYVICVPEDYDGKTPLPVVLFLHGSGQVGTDNRKQLEIGLAPALRQGGMRFPFIGVFPQARKSWLADSDDGKRALAILEAVEHDYTTDARRVYLTGVSMGGEGVWSLAAAQPKRFAAIVPVCGGGDLKSAAALTKIPCWAFHGDADAVVPVRATREMVQALTEAGGRPRYQEYQGVGHNCWDQVYQDADLYQWLQEQLRP